MEILNKWQLEVTFLERGTSITLAANTAVRILFLAPGSLVRRRAPLKASGDRHLPPHQTWKA